MAVARRGGRFAAPERSHPPIVLIDPPAARIGSRGVSWIVAVEAGEGAEVNLGHAAAYHDRANRTRTYTKM
jgi:hypothetical protein